MVPSRGGLSPGDTRYLDLGVALAVAPMPFGVLAPAQLESHHFFAESVGHDLRLDRGALHDRSSNLERRALADKEHLVEHQLAAHTGG